MKSKILIVEDEYISALNFEEYLSSFGFDIVSIVSDGDEAIKKAVELKPDLILMDITLKGDTNGIEAANKIKENHDIPILYITAHIPDNILEAKLTESYGYITKPINEEELKNKVELALIKHSQEKKFKYAQAKKDL